MKPPDLHVTALSDDDEFQLHLEPEGMIYTVVPGGSVRLRFPVDSTRVEVSWHATGLVVGRDVNCTELPEVLAEDGSSLDW